MPPFPDGFDPAIDRYDWRATRRLFQWLWPASDVSLACAQALCSSIRMAHEAGDASWAVTMFDCAIRLNVGQVEALTLLADQVRFLFQAPLSEEDARPGEVDLGSAPYYPAVPIPSGVCTVAADDVKSLPLAVRDSHDAYIRAAASFKRVCPHQKSFSPAVVEYLEIVLGQSLPRPSYLSQQIFPHVTPLPDELDGFLPIREGARYQITVNAYERNPIARDRCIAHYGPTCFVCGFNFGAAYGPVADGLIHVHHVKPLAEIGKKYKVDPITDLRPVCPNCHAVIHMGAGCRSIDEVKHLVEDAVRLI